MTCTNSLSDCETALQAILWMDQTVLIWGTSSIHFYICVSSSVSIPIVRTIASLFPPATAADERRMQRPNKRAGAGLQLLQIWGCVAVLAYGEIMPQFHSVFLLPWCQESQSQVCLRVGVFIQEKLSWLDSVSFFKKHSCNGGNSFWALVPPYIHMLTFELK